MRRPTLSTPGPIIPLAQELFSISSETVSGINARIGQAAIEAELLDSQTHERLGAYIEKKASDSVLVTQDEHSVETIIGIFDYWAKKLRQRLDEERGLR